DIGFKRIDFGASSFNNWIIFPSIGFYVFYFLYNAYSILIFKVSKESRAKSAEKIPKDLRIFLPITKEEKRTWDYVAISAGITEEVIYRGYLFYALAIVFPGLSLVLILLISTLLFGLGHIYQGTEAIKPTIVGLILGFLYIVFNSIIPIIIIHIAQDLVVRNLLDDENNNAN
ncbi:MAG: CPBP family intramembrane metalloprotease, partial [Candidatus Aminicenantes bacterium]|nr:CPBP family intramembrane metalloprotease [Candidatus Aminicenantes bacterium]